ncbi:tyrosine-type recombinase/integrase [Pontibacter harenae]|uniref:tyrosine-type recombinase/integrase n=1 Tax=Pontibacter harenae TaxID=2894083 RepID=UPI001E282CDB|nr:tyrosine-type recombinase/integrase [Pontibacter harenae]MCC9168926.1 tyrosine-type recombinase/integrase [Pontibacter harenae]
MEGLKDKRIELPSIKGEKTLPVVLSKPEMRRLLKVPALLKHRVLLGLLYGCGLRCFEARNLHLSDLDFDRRMLHVRKGKGKKDRYLSLSELLIRGLRSYIDAEAPQGWLFNGRPEGLAGGDFDCRYSQRGVQWVVKQAARQAGIQKQVTVHTLRHTFATHLLEDGLDNVSIKDLLGHESIQTTMVYLHVAWSGSRKPFSPLDTLYY